MPLVKKRVSIASGATSEQILAGTTYEYVNPGTRIVVAAQDATSTYEAKTNLNFTNETIILNQNYEIEMLNDQIKLYADRLKITDKWYNKRWFGIVIGVAGTSTAIYLAGQL